MSLKVKRVTGPADIVADFERLARQYPELAAESFVETIDNKIGPETQDEVPFEKGFLQGSWSEAQEPVIENGRVSVEFGYNTTYALAVHEIPPPEGGGIPPPPKKSIKTQVRRKGLKRRRSSKPRTARHRPPTKWKYLEDPTNRHTADPPNILLRLIDRLMGV